MADTRVHPVTGETLTRDVRKQTVQHAGLSADVMVPGWYPQGDGDAIHTGADLFAEQEAFEKLRAQAAAR